MLPAVRGYSAPTRLRRRILKGVSPDVAIAISDLSVEYAAHGPSAVCEALRGVTLDVQRGEVIGIMGESGSGKSTLARVLSGTMSEARGNNDVPPHIVGGDAIVLGHSMRHAHRRDLAEVSFHVGHLAQDAAMTLPPTLTVVEAVSAPIYARDKNYSPRAAGARAATIIDIVHLPLSVLNKYPYELSSGQRQRVAIARALVLGPSVLIADEPTAGIDATVRDAVIDLFTQLGSRGDFTAVLVSHDLAVLRRVSSRVAVLHEGRLVGLGPVLDLLAAPPHPYVASLAQALTQGRR
jgi:ABC-type glutathione transport system ATPase component